MRQQHDIEPTATCSGIFFKIKQSLGCIRNMARCDVQQWHRKCSRV